jgi:hypothetical protein
MVKGTVPDVGLLDSDLDFSEWVTRVTDLLVYKELDTCVEQDGNQLATAAEKSRDRKALSIIRSHVAPALLPYVQGLSTAKEAWDTLHQLYSTSLEAKKSLLEERLLKLQKAKSEDIASYVARAQKLRLELMSAGERISDDRVIRSILRGLSDEFKGVTEVLLFQSDLTIAKLLTHLKVAEERMSGSSSEDALALKAAAAKEKKKKNFNLECWNCGRRGHLKRDCRQPPKGDKKSKDGVAMTAVGVTVDGRRCSGYEQQDSAVAMTVAEVATDGEKRAKRLIDWVLDSGVGPSQVVCV